MGARIRAHDWSRSPLGPPERWGVSLRSVVSLMLNSKFPMFVAWGPELGFLYNDAYAEILGDKHPAALGLGFEQIWREIWPDIAPLVDAAMRGEAIYREDLPLLMNRYGFDEQTWFTFSYSPVEDAGQVVGMFCACVETTARIREVQRRRVLAELDTRLRDLDDASEILATSAELLGRSLGVDRAHWALVDRPADRFEVRQEWTAPGAPSLVGVHALSGFGDGLVAEMGAGGVIAVEDVARDVLTEPARVNATFGPALRGALSVPLLRNGLWRAALCVHTLTPRAWREDEQQLVQEVAERAWTRAERAEAEARVRSSEARLRALVSATSDITFRLSADWSEVREFSGCEFEGIDGRPEVAALIDFLPAEGRGRVRAAIDSAVATGGLFEIEQHVVVDGVGRWIRAWAVPLRDARGEIVEWFGVGSDITEQHRARQAFEQTAERLQLATEAAEVGFWDLDVAADVLVWGPRMKQMFGIPSEQPVSMEDFFAGVHSDDRERVTAALDAATDPQRRALYDVEFRTIGKSDGRVRWIAAKGRGIFDGQNTCVRLLGTALDITVRKSAEQHLRLMVNELNHRVKNSLATVQAITAQTLRRGDAPEELRQALTSRLVALADAHDVLTDEKWSGAELAELAAQAAAPYVSLSGSSPFEVRGPSVFLPPKTAIAMALAFHELATNAGKYGALSVPNGKVRLEWSVEPAPGGRALHLVWREEGGPPVAPPERMGFGTRLIQRGLATELQGAVSVDYRPDGLVCTMDALLPDGVVGGWHADLELI